MMMLHLIKKDILLVKKYVIITMAVMIIFPLFTMMTAPSVSGLPTFLYMAIIAELLLMQALSQEESKYPKAIALLCASPYKRSTFVMAKYTLILLIFAYCYIVHTLLTLALSQSGIMDLTSILTVLLINVIIFGVFVPLELKLGFVKAKFFSTVIILLFALGPSLLNGFFEGIDFSALTAMPSNLKNIVLALASIAALGISATVSIRIFARKDL